MKRFISTLLVLCMVCSFVPTIGAEPAEASKSGISVVYDWGTQMKTETENDPAPLKDAAFLSQFTFDSSHNLWK
ncbi:MAG: hypothetical protein IJO61_08595, partial [Oscillospiraceae bacterium]|nr:hypothetical protein [Oscillospiraceae bacterium]